MYLAALRAWDHGEIIEVVRTQNDGPKHLIILKNWNIFYRSVRRAKRKKLHLSDTASHWEMKISDSMLRYTLNLSILKDPCIPKGWWRNAFQRSSIIRASYNWVFLETILDSRQMYTLGCRTHTFLTMVHNSEILTYKSARSMMSNGHGLNHNTTVHLE